MSALDQTFFRPAKVLATDSGTAAEVVATVAGAARGRVYVTALVISGNGEPAAAVEATLAINGTTIPIQIPAAAFATIFINFAQAPLESDEDEDVVLTVPSLGTGVKCSVAIFGKRVGS